MNRVDEIIKLRKTQSLQQIGDKFGLSRERVRQLLRKVYSKEQMWARKRQTDYRPLPDLKVEDFKTLTAMVKASGMGWSTLRKQYPEVFAAWHEHFTSWVWSKQHEACALCGTTTIKHAAKGLCDRCYTRTLPGAKAARRRYYWANRDRVNDMNKARYHQNKGKK